MTPRPLRVAVAASSGGFPLGGQAWMILHYLLGLTHWATRSFFSGGRLGWAYPFDPAVGHGVADSSHGRAVLAGHAGPVTAFTAGIFYRSDIEGATWGASPDEARRFCASADLLVNVSGVIPLREEYPAPRVRAFIDTDPVFTQVKSPGPRACATYVLAHQFLSPTA
jgi:hypothetical protein